MQSIFKTENLRIRTDSDLFEMCNLYSQFCDYF